MPIRVASAETAELGRALTMTTCQPCQDINVFVTCIDEEAVLGHPFEMLIFGEEIWPSPAATHPRNRRAEERRDVTSIALQATTRSPVPAKFERTPPGFGWDPDPDL